jgi:hypothetical protein
MVIGLLSPWSKRLGQIELLKTRFWVGVLTRLRHVSHGYGYTMHRSSDSSAG